MQAVTPFINEPFSDFSQAANQQAFSQALAKVGKALGGEYPLVVGGERHKTGELIESYNPAKKSQLLGKFHGATVELTNQSIEVAAKTFVTWSRISARERSDYLFKAAKIMRQRKHEFSAVLVYEVGKSWAEADGDTAEAIDFLEFYARENLRYAEKQPLTAVAGEQNELHYLPIGVCVVIPPWNFPLAILAGMTAAAFVTGNTVVLKPSSDAPLIAMKFFELLEEIALPPGVVNFLPGRGGKVGDTLVKHPKTRLIAFTGSKAVGLNINELAAKTSEGQIWIKRVIAEMGGKDAIIVDEEADVEAAAEGVMRAAFGFQGQKCSACSRAIVHEKVYESFVTKLKAKVATLKVGNPADPGNYMGPVVNQKAYNSIMEYIRIGKQEGKLLCGGEIVADKGGDEGFFVAPTVFIDVDPRARISQEEIFGPILAVSKVKSFDEALQVANATEYGLTGALYSSNEKKLNRAIQEFHVGNLYLNRKCTGALVGAHPFGGFNMSGTDSKAGGRDYLLLFMQAKVWSRKL